jgi:hypothetical protein
VIVAATAAARTAAVALDADIGVLSEPELDSRYCQECRRAGSEPLHRAAAVHRGADHARQTVKPAFVHAVPSPSH